MAPIATHDLVSEHPEVFVTDPGAKAASWSSDPVLFGADDQWVFDPISKRFDLSRGSHRKLCIDADDGVRNHRGCIIDPSQ